jgi:hypothetical protein
MDINEILCEGVDWIQLAQDRVQLRSVVSTALSFRASCGGREILDQLSDYQLLNKVFCFLFSFYLFVSCFFFLCVVSLSFHLHLFSLYLIYYFPTSFLIFIYFALPLSSFSLFPILLYVVVSLVPYSGFQRHEAQCVRRKTRSARDHTYCRVIVFIAVSFIPHARMWVSVRSVHSLFSSLAKRYFTLHVRIRPTAVRSLR